MLKKMMCWCGVTAMLLLVQSAAVAGVTVSYVKTLGQTNVKGQPFKSPGARISLDKDGNLYLCGMVDSSWSMLMKLAPDGRVIWETPCSGGLIPTAVDASHVYVARSAVLRRFTLASGRMDYEWGYGNVRWGGAGQVPDEGGIKFKDVRSLLVSDSCIYVVDRGINEVKRLDKATGSEKPFGKRLEMVAPIDIAMTEKGGFLVLAGESVFEVDAEGNPSKAPIIEGLSGAVAVDVNPADGNIYVALGGAKDKPLNTINEYGADGKPTGVTIGHGGGFSGPWSADHFAFASGRGDIAVDSKGGVWVGIAEVRAPPVLPMIVHFDSQRKLDKILMGVKGSGLAVDPDLNVYVGGTCKITWDNQVAWTSGLTWFDDVKQYPVLGSPGWWFTVAYADSSKVVVFNPAGKNVMALSPANGTLLGGFHSVKFDNAYLSFFSIGKCVFYVTDGGVWKLDVETLAKPELFFKPPEGVKIGINGLAVSADGGMVYCSIGEKIVCFARKDGAKLWEEAGAPPMALMKNILWVRPGSRKPGLLALDTSTGKALGQFSDKESDGRLAISPSAIAVGSKDGRDYLFVAGEAQVQVLEVKR
jgi:DNA-binding beta-propeller fold protein YncE